MRKVVIIIISLFVFNNVYAETSLQSAKFSKCIDGDTAYLIIDDKDIKVRFLAIDTPETVDTNKPEETFGKEASDFTCNMLTNANEIIIETENSYSVDKYGRTLGWVWIDGKLLQDEIVKNGLGQVAYIYGKYKYTESLCLHQKEAENNKLNVWALESYVKGYCKTISLENVTDNIDYNKINDSLENLHNLENKFNKFSKYEEKFSKYVEDNEEKLSQIFLYVFIVITIGAMVYKEFKK